MERLAKLSLGSLGRIFSSIRLLSPLFHTFGATFRD
jgi:hypothetical protein